MQILILGGTSFIGKEMVRAFFEAGHSVTIFTRGRKKPTDLPPHQKLTGDRNSLTDLMTVGKGKRWDVVIDNIGYQAEDLEKVITAFKTARHLIFNSTVSVYRYSKQAYPQPLIENSIDHNAHPAEENLENIHWKYARGKLDAEKVILEQCQIPWTIIRPPVVYGPDDVTQRGFWYLMRLLDGGPLLLANGGVNSFRLAYSKDVAQVFLRAALNPQAFGQTYYVAQREIVTLKDFIDESAQHIGVDPNYVSVPSEIIGELGGPHSSMVNIVVDIQKAERELGFKPTPFAQMIQETTEWFKAQWKGDREEILKTRPQELVLGQKWKNVMEEFL